MHWSLRELGYHGPNSKVVRGTSKQPTQPVLPPRGGGKESPLSTSCPERHARNMVEMLIEDRLCHELLKCSRA